jgi:hypothetical protein
MESIYYVMSWVCHRACPHCYEDRFRPYYGDDLRRAVEQAMRDSPRIIENLPARMSFRDLSNDLAEKRGRIILAGGEILLPALRETVLYPGLDQLHAKYQNQDGVELIVQTTGDILTAEVLDALLEHHVNVVSVSGMDEYHEGFTEEVRARIQESLLNLFEARGMTEWSAATGAPDRHYHFFGATPDSWIGRLWPRGRAFSNELTTASLADNFCNRWSGGLNFLQTDYNGSEVSIDPEGNVFPCCIKTKLPLGNVAYEPLEEILRRLEGDPVYEAISMGHPERMGISHGWTVQKFLEKSRTVLPSGRAYTNLCIGCDAFHTEVLAGQPGSASELVQITPE